MVGYGPSACQAMSVATGLDFHPSNIKKFDDVMPVLAGMKRKSEERLDAAIHRLEEEEDAAKRSEERLDAAISRLEEDVAKRSEKRLDAAIPRLEEKEDAAKRSEERLLDAAIRRLEEEEAEVEAVVATAAQWKEMKEAVVAAVVGGGNGGKKEGDEVGCDSGNGVGGIGDRRRRRRRRQLRQKERRLLKSLEANHPASGCAETWDPAGQSSLEESAEGMARGAATWDAATMSTLEESAKGMAQGAATWDATKMSLLEESAAKGMTNTITDHQQPPRRFGTYLSSFFSQFLNCASRV